MIDPATDQLIHLKDVPPLIARSSVRRPFSYDTIRSWTIRGARGVYLESVVIGVERFTTVTAVHEFIKKCTEADAQRHPAVVGRKVQGVPRG
jgi:hypothetical protein